MSPDAFSFRLRLRLRSSPSHYRYLGYLIQPKPLAPRNEPQTEAREREREQSRMSSLSMSIHSIGHREGSKGAKFPKELIKTLDTRLQLIAMGKDPSCVIADGPRL